MLLINNKDVTDPRINLALEEYCLRHLDPENEYLLFYVNEPSVIVGKHQVPFREVDCEYARRKGLRIIRRISGGGAVYHDFGNLNFSFITNFEKQKLRYFRELIRPIVGTLNRLGVPAVITETNDIVIGDKKISGTSQYTNMKRMLSHGTLLLNSDLEMLNSVLVSNPEIIQSRGVESIHSEVTNISDHLSGPMAMTSLLKELISGISGDQGELNEFVLTPQSWDFVNRLSEEKYKTWQWTYGRSPSFIVGHKFKTDGMDLFTEIRVIHGIIQDIKILGDKLEHPAVHGNISRFIGRRYGSEFKEL